MKQIFATLGGCEGLVTGDCIYGEVHAVPCQIFFYGGFAIGIDCVSGPRPCELGEVISSWTAHDTVSDMFLIFVLLNWGGANVTIFWRSPTLLQFS